ncbi:hypothetical protein HK098_006088 [Nowakowskiella sp. JEL0407]|nr:hypothetical protein HK098_006088 [Nowakowskiella sp. JEL0407]
MGDNSGNKYDLFLSYCWADKPAVLKIRDALKARKLNVWFDKENMRDRVNAAMANGIESSAIFVCCLSNAYEKSDNAMAEFRYASYLKKKFIAIRLEDGKRDSEIEFVVGPTLWFLYENGDERKLLQAVYYIEKEVDILNPRLATGNLRVITMNDINFGRDSKCIGSGGFGAVYKVKLDETEDAVFKKLHDATPSLKAKREFLNEAEIMAKLSHPRIVRFFGIVDDPETNIVGIVMEIVSRGSLYDVIENTETAISLSKRFHILSDIATGVKVLHDQRILHKDIKSKNILIDEQWRAKICDFGLAKIKKEVSTQNPDKNQLAGTSIYMAPELFEYESQSELTDVFAFAVVMSEVITWSGPYGLDWDVVDPRVLVHNISISKIPQIMFPSGTPDGFAEFLSDTWNRDPLRRPLFWQIRERLLEFLKETSAVEQAQETIEDDLSSKFNSILLSEINVNIQNKNKPSTLSQDELEAMYQQALKYVTGIGADHSMQKAMKFMPSTRQYSAPSDVSLIFKYAKYAADENNAMGMEGLGYCYYEEYRKTCHSCVYLGDCYKYGRGVAVNSNLADEYYQKAFEGFKSLDREALAQVGLGNSYKNGEGLIKTSPVYQYGYGITKDYNEAVKWYTKAAEQGNASGQIVLNGYGVTKDYNEAVKWYTKAAEQGDSNGQCGLGYCYENGYGVAKNETEALRWYKLSTDQGDSDAAAKVKELSSKKKSWFERLIS